MKLLTVLLLISTSVFAQDPGCEDCDTNLPPYNPPPVLLPVGSTLLRVAKVDVWNEDDKSDLTNVMNSTLWYETGTNNQMQYDQTWTIPPSEALTYEHAKWTLAVTNATDTNRLYTVLYRKYYANYSTDFPVELPWRGTNQEHLVSFSVLDPNYNNHFFLVKSEED